MKVSYGYPSSPTLQGQYRKGILAVLLYKGNTLRVSQQLYYPMTVYYGYLGSLTVQGQYPMSVPAALLYKDSTL